MLRRIELLRQPDGGDLIALRRLSPYPQEMDTLESRSEGLESILPPGATSTISEVWMAFEAGLKECYILLAWELGCKNLR